MVRKLNEEYAKIGLEISIKRQNTFEILGISWRRRKNRFGSWQKCSNIRRDKLKYLG